MEYVILLIQKTVRSYVSSSSDGWATMEEPIPVITFFLPLSFPDCSLLATKNLDGHEGSASLMASITSGPASTSGKLLVLSLKTCA